MAWNNCMPPTWVYVVYVCSSGQLTQFKVDTHNTHTIGLPLKCGRQFETITKENNFVLWMRLVHVYSHITPASCIHTHTRWRRLTSTLSEHKSNRLLFCSAVRTKRTASKTAKIIINKRICVRTLVWTTQCVLSIDGAGRCRRRHRRPSREYCRHSVVNISKMHESWRWHAQCAQKH